MSDQKNEDLVTIGEAARLLDVDNQLIYMRRERNPSTFPRPRVQGRSARLYSLAELTKWMREYDLWRNR